MRAVVRPNLANDKTAAIDDLGAPPVTTNFADPTALQKACSGADCVISALNGLEPIMVDLQSCLLDAGGAGRRSAAPAKMTREVNNKHGRLQRIDQNRMHQ